MVYPSEAASAAGNLIYCFFAALSMCYKTEMLYRPVLNYSAAPDTFNGSFQNGIPSPLL